MPDSITLYQSLTEFAERHAGTRLTEPAAVELAGLLPGLNDRARRDFGADLVYYQHEHDRWDGDRDAQSESVERRDGAIADAVRAAAAATSATRRSTVRQAQILHDARRLLMRGGWQQGRYHGRAGRDLVMALVEAVGPQAQHRLADLVLLLHEHLPATVRSLIAWNDAPDRSLTDVLGLLNTAASHCERTVHA